MKTTRMCYNDDGVLIPGVLIQRLFRKPVFVSMEPGCGWDTQTICGKTEEKNLHPYSKYLYQEANFAYSNAIKMALKTSSKVDEILNSPKAQTLRGLQTDKEG